MVLANPKHEYYKHLFFNKVSSFTRLAVTLHKHCIKCSRHLKQSHTYTYALHVPHSKHAYSRDYPFINNTQETSL